jgi:transposase-like protein
MDKKRPSSKRYPPELKDRAVRMVQELRLRDPG